MSAKELFIERLSDLLNLQDAATARSIDAAVCGTPQDHQKKHRAQQKLEDGIKEFAKEFMPSAPGLIECLPTFCVMVCGSNPTIMTAEKIEGALDWMHPAPEVIQAANTFCKLAQLGQVWNHDGARITIIRVTPGSVLIR